MTKVGTEQSGTSDAWMNPIRLKVDFTVPKDSENVNKPYPMGEARQCQHCIQGPEINTFCN